LRNAPHLFEWVRSPLSVCAAHRHRTTHTHPAPLNRYKTAATGIPWPNRRRCIFHRMKNPTPQPPPRKRGGGERDGSFASIILSYCNAQLPRTGKAGNPSWRGCRWNLTRYSHRAPAFLAPARKALPQNPGFPDGAATRKRDGFPSQSAGAVKHAILLSLVHHKDSHSSLLSHDAALYGRKHYITSRSL
jgi:hypothetical protein